MAFTEFYVTKGSSASDVNGGGPSLGTNDAAVDTSTNCSSAADGLTITDDDAGGWPNAAEQDWICFDTAGTKDFARITNIAGEVLTVTPAVATSASSKTVNVGGAWATVDHAASTITTAFVNGSSDNPRINIKYNATPYDETTNGGVTLDNSGSTGVPITFEGYAASAGDLSASRPEIKATSGGPLAGVITGVAGKDYFRLVNLKVTATQNGQHAISAVADRSLLSHLELSASGTTASGIFNSGVENFYFDVYVSGSTGDGFGVSGESFFFACYSKDSGAAGYDLGGGTTLVSCIADNPATAGIEIGNSASVIGCSVYSAGGDGINGGSGRYGTTFINNILMDSGAWGIDPDGMLLCAYNAFQNNSSGEIDAPGIAEASVTLSGDPFNGVGGNDFSLNNTGGAGAACRDAGFDAGDNIGSA